MGNSKFSSTQAVFILWVSAVAYGLSMLLECLKASGDRRVDYS